MQIHSNIRSDNFTKVTNNRNISFIILHYTELDFDTSVQYLCSKEKGVSSHYLIDKNGEIFCLIDEKHIAWHAGKSYWRGIEELNNHSVGIEIENLGNEAFPKAQMDSVIWLCSRLKKQYQIPRENILGHSDIAPDRKVDPGIFFDWKLLGNHGLGIPIPSLDEYLPSLLPRALNIQDIQEKLLEIGYKIDITGKLDLQTKLVIRAFQMHFCPKKIVDNASVAEYRWDEESSRILLQLVEYCRKNRI